jgi:hypothetical protein
VRTGNGTETLQAIQQGGDPRYKEVPVYDDLAAFVEHHMLDGESRAVIR